MHETDRSNPFLGNQKRTIFRYEEAAQDKSKQDGQQVWKDKKQHTSESQMGTFNTWGQQFLKDDVA
jgi:hypothetical protein